MVGVSRLELLTSRSQSARATNCAKPRLAITIPQNMLKLKHEKLLATTQAYLLFGCACSDWLVVYNLMFYKYSPVYLV